MYVYPTVHDIRIVENVAILMMSYETTPSIPVRRMIFVWMRLGSDWKLVSSMNNDE